MQFPQILTPLAVLALTLVFSSPAPAQIKAEDGVISEMHQAFRKNDKARLTALLPQARGHTLEPWAAYWELRARLDLASSADVQDFASRYAGSYQEDRLRTEWLQQLGKRRDWVNFAAEYPRYRMRDDKEVRCYALAADLATGSPDTVTEFKRLWYAQKEVDDGCNYAADRLHAARKIDGLDLWRKARIAMENSRPRAAQLAVEIEAKDVGSQVALIQADPIKYLDKRLMAIRIAATNPDLAAEQLHKRWGLFLSKEERNWTWGAIGKQAAFKLQDNAGEYFAKVTRDADLNDDLLGWKVRAALRQGDWKTVGLAIDAMQDSASEPVWVYWRARAALASNPNEAQRQAALQSLRAIASVRGFYEQLALEETGQAIALPAKPNPLTFTEKAAASANMGLQRALYAIGTGYLKLVLDDFGGSMPMAAAAYNAGPSRPRSWRNGPVLEAAIWAENIPFLETRDYVKKVLANTTNYAAVLTGQPQSLKSRLGSVGPKPVNAVESYPDLP